MTEIDELKSEKRRLRMELDVHKREHRCSGMWCKEASDMHMQIANLAWKITEVYRKSEEG